ncbi:IS1182 family transposase [Kribbella sp. VKM Ac-2571]|uniref:IS1182 family transposase n=1 Tax=Kribbella sp. VKM Ac-2571 TaxID=2512222 RepID=UPI0035122BDB
MDQLMLMPPSVREWLPEDHLAFFVVDTVAELDLAEFFAAYRTDGRGGSVYDPAMMLAVLLYAYCTGERSSRRVERRLVEDVAYRVVAANQQPDHATIARFRARHEDAIAGLFGQVLGLCVRAGLVDAGVIAIDGTKIAANASFFVNREGKALAKELAAMAEHNQTAGQDGSAGSAGSAGSGDLVDAAHEIAKAILDEAAAVDAVEDAEHGDARGDELPAEWAGGRDRRARIRAALDELESQKSRDYESRMAERAKKETELGRKLTGPKPKEDAARRSKPRRANTTDPHSRIIAQASKGVMQGYNAQTAATTAQIVIAAEVTATSNDQPHFVPMATAVTENLTDAGHAEGVGTFVADAGYWTAANGTTPVGAEVLIATKKTSWRKADKPDDDKLAVLAKVNRGELSQRKAGEILGVSHTWVRDMTKRYFGTEGQRITRSAEPEPAEWIPVIERVDRGEISKRAARDQLDVSDTRINAMLAHVRGEATDPTIARKAMDAKLAEPGSAELYKKRASSIEPVFGNIKHNLRFRRFARRSLPAVHSEWRLICTVHNLLKLQQATPA